MTSRPPVQPPVVPPQPPRPEDTLPHMGIPHNGQEVISHVTSQPTELPGHNFDPQLRAQYANEPGVIHATREIEPPRREISAALQAKHEESKRDYPFLNLSEGEYVILNIQRHPIGLFIPIGMGAFIITMLLSFLILYPSFITEFNQDTLPGFGIVALCIIPVGLLVGLFSYIAVWVYLRNQFFLTNESIIQEIQHSLFSRHEQTVSLGSIEDVSFRQNGVLQALFNYGSIRLSTEGEETTYQFYYVANPKEQIATLNNAVESFKNGRPVGDV